MLGAQVSRDDGFSVIHTVAALVASNIILVAASSLFFFISAYVVYQRCLSPLSKFPGPFWASLSPLWKLIVFRNGDFHLTILKLHEKYGKNVRIAPNEVIVAEGAAIRPIYGTVEGRDFLKTDYYEYVISFRRGLTG